MSRVPGAWVALAVVTVAVPSRAFAQDNVAFAQTRYLRGVDLYHAHRYEAALVELRASLALYGSPNPRLYIARCLRDEGDPVGATAEYQRTASEARERARLDPRYAPTADNAEAELARLTSQLARITVRVDPSPTGLTVRVADRALPSGALGLPVFVMPGSVHVDVTAPGYAPVARRVELSAGGERTVDIALHIARNDRPRESAFRDTTARTIGWTATGITAVGLVSSGLFFGLAQSQYDTLGTRCDHSCDPQTTRAGRTYEWTSNVSWMVTGAGALTALVAFLVAARTESAHASTVRLVFGPLGAAGTF